MGIAGHTCGNIGGFVSALFEGFVQPSMMLHESQESIKWVIMRAGLSERLRAGTPKDNLLGFSFIPAGNSRKSFAVKGQIQRAQVS